MNNWYECKADKCILNNHPQYSFNLYSASLVQCYLIGLRIVIWLKKPILSVAEKSKSKYI